MGKLRATQWVLLMAGFAGIAICTQSNFMKVRACLKQTGADCMKAACNTQTKIVDHSSCPQPPMANLRETCKFDKAAGDLLWCEGPSDLDCEIVCPTEQNRCWGSCEKTPGIPCEGTNYNKCKQP